MKAGICWAPAAGVPCTPSYPVHKDPPWGLSALFGLQHLLVQSSLLFVCHALLLQYVHVDRPTRYQLLATSLFTSGISTSLQTTLGSRLPLVQAPSFELLIPAMILSRQVLLAPPNGGNDTAGPPACSEHPCWQQLIQEVSGAVLIAGLLQLLCAVSGVCGMVVQRSGPMVLASTLSIIGLSSYREAALASSTHWGAALLYVGLTLAGPPGGFAVAESALLLLSSLDLEPTPRMPAADVLPGFPHALGELGWPLLSTRSVAAGVVLAISSSMNSLGCYVLCARVLRAPSLPRQACNRGVCMEAVGNILSGTLGSISGAFSSIPNACTVGLTQVGSRHSVIVGAMMCIFLGVSPKAVEVLSTIPMAVHGGVLCVTYGLAVGVGISFFQYANIDSGRNIFIVGFTMFMALLVPRWLTAAPDYLSTGSGSLDLLLLSLLMSPVFLGAVFSFFLDNTISGTLEERGLLPELSLWKPDSGNNSIQARRKETQRVYGLSHTLRRSCGLSRLNATFPCRTFCLPDIEVDAREAEKVTSTEEGAILLEKPTSVEIEPVIRLHQGDTERDIQSEC
ncbi:solute carrier family 23 member 3 isoform X2 [Pleurodeles waltl]|uniref:solute carrier family 23 member 3 isoform X2 n=1 Tax=Pleurodeles waltl TaxID=8319 RepID=UPI00370992E8